MIDDVAFHCPGEGKPSVRFRHVSGLHEGFVVAEFLGEFFEAVINEDGEKETVSFGGGAKGG